MPKRLWLFLLILSVGLSPCLAQPTAAPARNAVFFELLGNGGLYSLNFERMLREDLGLRVGYASWSSPLLF
jgi:hypothetical protein